MNNLSLALFSSLLVLGPGSHLDAQGKAKPKKPATSAAKAPRQNLEAQFARQNFKQVLDAVNQAWFGEPYRQVGSVDLQGTLGITLSAAAINSKVNQASDGAIQGGATKGGTVNLRLKGTYFAKGDFRTELNGDFGTLLYYRSGNKGFLYSKAQNAYTTRVDLPPSDAPLTFLGWFRQCLNDIQAVYVDGPTFRASLGKEVAVGGANYQTLVFTSPTSAYDPKKREQSMAESLGFWKRGRLEVVFDKSNHLPHQMNYSNDAQGVHTQMTFNYGQGGKLSSVNIANQSKGMEGPASLQVSYGGDGLMSHVAGEMAFSKGRMRFDMDLSWSKTRKPASIVTVPPPGAAKKGREEMETMLLVNLAGKLLELQRNGFNLRSVTLVSK
jgi:hypothetical protein